MDPRFAILDHTSGYCYTIGTEKHCQESLPDALGRYPDRTFSVLPLDDAAALSDKMQRDRHCTGFTEVDHARFWELLEILPPCRWVNTGSFECFHISEHITNDIVTWVCAIATGQQPSKRYFTINESCYLKHDDLHKMLLAHLQ